MDIIESLENNKVKYWNKLNDKKFRDIEGLFLVEGDHLVMEAYKTSNLQEIICLSSFNEELDVKTTYVSNSIMKKLSRMESISNVIGVVRKLKPLRYGNRLLLLDNIQDPGNLGTIIRSAAAFNIDTVILGNGCVDLYNDKVIRSSEGMIFRVDVMSYNLPNLIEELKNNNYIIYGTDVVNGTNISDISFKDKFGIVIGNEGKGISLSVKQLVDKNIYIPISDTVESLNASIAASIIMYEMSKIDYE